MSPDLGFLVSLSRFLGSNPGLVQGKGGNTSFKHEGMLYVKTSGIRLRDVRESDFIPLELASVRAIIEGEAIGGRLARERLLALSNAVGGKPSIETFLHAAMPGEYVAHLHPVYANALGCMEGGETLVQEIFGPDEIVWVGYRMPGYEVGLKLHAALKASTGNAPRLALMANHGLIVASESPEGILASLSDCLGRMEARLGSIPEPKVKPFPQQGFTDMLGKVMNQHARWSACPFANMLALEPALFAGPLFPDQIVYCGERHPEFAGDESEAQAGAVVASFTEANGYGPRYAVVAGAGVILPGRDEDEILLREEVLGAYAKVSMLLKRLGARPRVIPEVQCRALLFGEG